MAITPAITPEELRSKLSKHVIDKSKPEWCAKMKNVDDEEVEIPPTLDGQVLLEIDEDEKGKVRGFITIAVEDLAKQWDIVLTSPAWKKYVDKWKAEGLI